MSIQGIARDRSLTIVGDSPLLDKPSAVSSHHRRPRSDSGEPHWPCVSASAKEAKSLEVWPSEPPLVQVQFVLEPLLPLAEQGPGRFSRRMRMGLRLK